MIRAWGRGGLIAVALWTFGACAGRPPTGAPPAAPASLGDGVYTAEQAAIGAARYAEACSSCHATDLRGNSNSPGLVGSSFLFLWEGKSLGELFTTMRSRMPTNAPNSLPAEAYASILAHILAANQFPAGPRPLAPDPALLDPIIITSNR